MLTYKQTSTNRLTLCDPEWDAERSSIIIPINEDITIKPNEIKIIDLGISMESSKDIKMEAAIAQGWENNSKIIINTNLLRNKYEEGEKISIQNTTDEKIRIGKNTNLIEIRIKEYPKENTLKLWEEFEEREEFERPNE